MQVVEGRVTFRNRMGKSIFMKVEQADGQDVMVWFRKGVLGEDLFERARAVDLFATIRVEVGNPIRGQHETVSPVEEVISLGQ
jgi:lysyl-tRNA synthetase class II